ncbi:MAG TPA: hypothetical protein VEB41_10915 [Burkholderiales bacterium]|nr:hypothetical protein [Burkholderiales bacterium]
MRYLLVAFASAVLATSSAVQAEGLAIAPNDSIQTVLASQKGKRTTVRVRSGQEITGIVRDVNATLVVIGSTAGREFFDAVVPLEAVDAVLVRTK